MPNAQFGMQQWKELLDKSQVLTQKASMLWHLLHVPTLARCRNATLSAVAYRISTILFHGGLQYRDMMRLNRLGVCMSPDSIVNFQRQLGVENDAKVLLWKKSIEENYKCLAFLQELKQKQGPICDEDDMMVDIEYDFSDATVRSYTSYAPGVYQHCNQLFQTLLGMKGNTVAVISDQLLDAALNVLRKEKLPKYK